MKVVGLVSGGKDSCYAMMKCIEYGHEIVALANLMPMDDSIDELDSYMYQTVGHQIVVSYAECMGLPLFRRRIRGSARHHHLSYTMTAGDEVEDMFILLNEVKQKIPSITAVSTGAIASDYQRLRVESICSRLGLVSLAYLWKQDQSSLLHEMITNGIVAITVKVAAMGLNPGKHLGKELAVLQPQLLQLNELYGINVCGEGGEYETLTLDCPLFINARIVLDDYQVVLHSTDSIVAPVGILHPSAFHLEYKISSCNIMTGSDSVKMANVYEVEGDSIPTYGVKSRSLDLVSDLYAAADQKIHMSSTTKDTFSIGCWIQDSSGRSEGLQKDLTAVLKKVELQLHKGGFDWVNVLYIHLYIANMNDFGLANETYVSFITERKCNLGVPSRSTIELPLMQVGLGKAYVEILVANDQTKKVLHVQSISCWAPSCIGPYSQATLHKEILHMAGQLGLDPATMMLCPGGPIAELKQALENCQAVASSFNCSLYSSAISFVIYCSASVTSSMGLIVLRPTRATCVSLACFVVTILCLVSNGPCQAQLSSTFYDKTCSSALGTIQTAVRTAVSRERRMAASLMRLHFHDCFVQGCDASVLLDDTSSSLGEKSAFQNLGSLRGFEVIDSVKSKVEDVCPGVVSCADLLAVVARDASVAVGGPTWTVKLGRRDSMSASQSLAESNLPRATDGHDDLISLFGSKGLNSKEMVALSGSHTIGQAQCITFRPRIYNETNIDAGFASTRRRRCSFTDGDSNIAPLDLVTPNSFDNNYFKNLIQKKGLLTTDQVLFNGGSTDNFVTEYSKDRSAFYRDFALAMIKMGDIDPLTGSSGQIRRNCRVTN